MAFGLLRGQILSGRKVRRPARKARKAIRVSNCTLTRLLVFTGRGTSVTSHPLSRRSLSAYADREIGRQGSDSPQLAMDSFRLYGLVTGGAALLAAYALLRRKPKRPDDLERERRAWLESTGRITDGTVIDVQELAAADHYHAATMLIYKYDVAGVSYECSQDVTYLRHWINLHSCRLGLPTSVKYDPQNPGNSLVVSENWMGLRQ